MCGISVGYLRLCEGGVESIAPGKRNGLWKVISHII